MRVSLTNKEYVIMSLLVQERSGRQLAERFQALTKEKISFGTLYAILRRLKIEGWVEVRFGEDRRERYFKLNGSGSSALNRSTDQRQKLLTLGRTVAQGA